jgi:Xaa-Pro aminopeptidase
MEVLRNGDSHFPFRQQSDFYYLTGFNEAEAIAVFIPGRAQGEYILFNRPRDPLMETWNGRRAGQIGAVAHYGADEAFPITEFAEKLPDLLTQSRRLYYPIGREAALDELIVSAVNKLRRKVRSGLAVPLEFINIEDAVSEMRLIKSPAEIAMMRTAGAISATAHIRAMKKCHPGLAEYHLQAEMQYEFNINGQVPSYNFIIGSGENACILHYQENDAILKDGDLVLIDAACEYENYAADITRTFPANGRFTAEQRAVYEVVLQAQLAVIASIRPGLRWHETHDLGVRKITEGLIQLGLLQGRVDELIATKAYNKFYMHLTGHWLGLDVHDAGAYKQEGEWRALKPGMVFTVEPGIYIAANTPGVDPKWWNIGVRIEDDIVVTENGCEVLSTGVPKTIAELEALIGTE